MKNSIFFQDFLDMPIIYKNKKIQKPKVGDNIFVKFFYVQGIKILRFYSKTFFGRCISLKRQNRNTTIIKLRNVYNRDPIELSFFLNSSFVVQIKKKKNDHFFFKKNKLYFLRDKKIAQSKVKR